MKAGIYLATVLCFGWIALFPEGMASPAGADSAPGDPEGRRESQSLGDAWSDSRNPIVALFGGQRLDLWSLRPIRRPALPLVRTEGWVRNGMDRFVLETLEAARVAPLPEADRRTLGRRLYFDLTGLPPTAEEMRAFLEDVHPDAYERLVDRLLNSPRYGEHWARLWLDVVRYSDSNGFDWDEFRPRAWRFRDYVIRSFNADKPFDQFVREQLAGDELVGEAPRDGLEQDALIATGYLRLGPHDNSAGSFNEQARSRAELMSDLVETTGSAFLGLSLSCCRCHDHKYDPLSQADYFRMRAFFEPVKFADQLPLDLAPEQERIRRHNESLESEAVPLRKERETLLAAVKSRLRAERLMKLTAEEQEWLALAKEQRTEALKGKIEGIEKKVEPREKEVLAALTSAEKERETEFSKRLEAIQQKKRSFDLGLVMTDGTEPPAVTRILFQGDHKQERQPVVPGFFSALDPNPAVIQKGRNPKTTGRRLTLANWIASPENPLTARVWVNRVWQGYFGEGLVATANDFGLAGARPTQPELLDWLAGTFMAEGWSVKRLHRLIVTSATYRQRAGVIASTGALGAAHFGRIAPRRLSAEQLRDALLAVAGTLRERMGGPPVWPELDPAILQANPAFLDDNAERTKGWYPSPVLERNARSIYLVQKRTVRVPFLETFDLPENSTSCPKRVESTVAPQALTLLNSPMAVAAARGFAARLEQEVGNDPAAQVTRAFEAALQRSPDAEEFRRCLEFRKDRSLAEFCRVLLNVNEFVYVD